MTEDPTIFLADWGQRAVIDGVEVGLGIFSEPSDVDRLAGGGARTGAPRFLLPDALIPAQTAGDATEQVLELPDRQADGKTFRFLIRDTEPDSLGWVSLILVNHPSQS